VQQGIESVPRAIVWSALFDVAGAAAAVQILTCIHLFYDCLLLCYITVMNVTQSVCGGG
jgi:hypothetical protein